MDLAYAYLKRISLILQSKNYDLIWIEKEALPWIPGSLETLLLRSQVPYIVDYDDAAFHRYDQHRLSRIRKLLGQKIDHVMRQACLVIVGNDYLAERAARAGAKYIEILPTVVDLQRYPLIDFPQNPIFTIGWIGSPLKANDYLKAIEPALRVICQEGKARVIAIGASDIKLEGVPLEIKLWCEATEVEEIQQFDVGIMPLSDTPFERGKCGLKLIQYMASSLPVIGSPVGVNSKIIVHGVNGFQASSISEWIGAFDKLRNDPTLRKKMGQAGRKIVESHYSLKVTAPKLADLILKIKI
jgi:glycosyltransferase involved in cell wall biosynthesis